MLINMWGVVVCLVILILKVVLSDADNGFVTVSVNKYRLNFSTTISSVSYVGEAIYKYEDGEDLYVSCKNHEYTLYTTLHLEYYNAEGTLLFKTLPGRIIIQPEIFFRSSLKSINDMYYLDCIRATREREYRYRTTFYMEKRDLNNAVQRALILSVNGQKLTVIKNNAKPSDEHYLFSYTDGDILNVSCRKTDINMRGSLSFFYNDTTRPVGPVIRSPSEGSISLNISATMSNLFRIILTCSINNSDIQNPEANLYFESDISETDVHVRGLLTNNILYQYTNGRNRWTIEYQYSENETLNLTCIGKGRPSDETQRFQWEFNGESIVSEASFSTSVVFVAKKIFLKTLNSNHTGKMIQCVYKSNSHPYSNKTVEIILHLKPKAVIKESEDGEIISSCLEEIAECDKAADCLENETESVDTDRKSSWASDFYILLGGSIAAAVLGVLTGTSAARYCVRMRNARSLIKTQEPMASNKDSVNYNSSVYEIPNENDNQFNVYHHVVVSNNDTVNATYENVQNIDPEDHDYAEILNFH